MNNTPCKEIFMQLVRFYVKSDWTGDDFVKVQLLRDDILTKRATSKISFDEYKVLYSMADYLVKSMRDILRKRGDLHD